MKGKKFLFVTAVFALFLFTPLCVSASDLRLPDSAWDVNYTVEVSAPDGGVNFRWGPGVEYGKIQESMIPNGTLLPIFKEATAQNGNNWGLTAYNDTSGWIALTQVSVVADSTSEPEKGIVFKHFMENGMEHATVTSYDKEGKTLWTYKTDSYEGAQCNRVSEIGQQNGYFYLVEDGVVAALDELTGEIVWKNEEFIGAGTEKGYVFDKNGTLYISGYLGPDLFIVDKNGKTLYRKDSFEKGYWPYEMELKDENILRIHFESDMERKGTQPWMEIRLEELEYR